MLRWKQIKKLRGNNRENPEATIAIILGQINTKSVCKKHPVMYVTYSLGRNKPEKGYCENILKAAKDFFRFMSEGGSVTKLKN